MFIIRFPDQPKLISSKNYDIVVRIVLIPSAGVDEFAQRLAHLLLLSRLSTSILTCFRRLAWLLLLSLLTALLGGRLLKLFGRN